MAPVAAPTVVSLQRNGGSETYDQLDSITLVFSESVNVSRDDLTLRDASAGGTLVDLTGAVFAYDVATATGTWDFTNIAPIPPVFYTVSLNAANVTNTSGLALDGDGDGTGGDDFNATFLVAKAGDTDLDGDVDFTDAKNLITRFDPSGSNPGNDWFSGNFDGDSDVDTDDFDFVKVNFSPTNYAAPPAANISALAQSGRFESEAVASVAGDVRAMGTRSDEVVAVDRAFADLVAGDFNSTVLDDSSSFSRVRSSRRLVVHEDRLNPFA